MPPTSRRRCSFCSRPNRRWRMPAAAAFSTMLRPSCQASLRDWWGEIKEWQRKDCLKYDKKSALIKPQFVVEKLYELTGGDAFIISDVGQHQRWAAQYYKLDKPRRLINSGGLGTMGFG